MARPALSASRGLDVLALMSAFPARSFTLSEIADSTGINLASIHAILNALSDRGYVARQPGQKSFGLGPVLVAVGAAALRANPMLERARRVVRELAAKLDVPVLLSAQIGEDIVGIVAEADADGRLPAMREGESRPFVPPLGAPFVAWQDDAAITDWLSRATKKGAENNHRAAIATIRDRGFQITLHNPDAPRLALEIGDMAAGRLPKNYKSRLIGQAGDLDSPASPTHIQPDELYDVVLVAAPVFDSAGQCAFNLCLGNFRQQLSGRTLDLYSEELLAACLKVMQD